MLAPLLAVREVPVLEAVVGRLLRGVEHLVALLVGVDQLILVLLRNLTLVQHLLDLVVLLGLLYDAIVELSLLRGQVGLVKKEAAEASAFLGCKNKIMRRATPVTYCL